MSNRDSDVFAVQFPLKQNRYVTKLIFFNKIFVHVIIVNTYNW